LTKADLHSSGCTAAQFPVSTTFCRTIDCNGQLRNDDCPGVPAAAVCCRDTDCPTGHSCLGNRCVCRPATCASVGVTCGTAPDGCGNTLTCSCPIGQQCSSCLPTGEPGPATCCTRDRGGVPGELAFFSCGTCPCNLSGTGVAVPCDRPVSCNPDGSCRSGADCIFSTACNRLVCIDRC
jgi:hypothetical protein